jgi:hypothetical protein
MDDPLLYVLVNYENCSLLLEHIILFISGSSCSAFPYSASHSHHSDDDGTAPPMIDDDVQDEQALISRFTFNFPTTGTVANHGPQHHAWYGSRGSYGEFLSEVNSYMMPNQPFNSGGMPPPSSFETQIVSDPQPSVSYTGHRPVNGGYQYPILAGINTEYGSPFAMPQYPMVSQTPLNGVLYFSDQMCGGLERDMDVQV